jgi:hypothetical protein
LIDNLWLVLDYGRYHLGENLAESLMAYISPDYERDYYTPLLSYTNLMATFLRVRMLGLIKLRV